MLFTEQFKSLKIFPPALKLLLYKKHDITKPGIIDIEQSMIKQLKISQKSMLQIKQFMEETCYV